MKKLLLFLLLSSAAFGQGVRVSGAANGIFYVDGTTFTLVSAYSACTAQGSGKIILAPGYTETLASQIKNWNGNCSIELPEAGTITVPPGREFSCAGSACDGISITGRDGVPYGTPAVGGRPGFKFVCSPGVATACFSISGPNSPVGGVKLTGFAIDTSAGNATSIGLSVTQLYHYEVALRFIGPGGNTSQVGWALNGGGSFSGDNRTSYFSANGYRNGLQLNSNANFNHIQGLCANIAAGGACANISGSNGNFLYFNGDNVGTAVNLTNNRENFGNWILLYGQGNASDVTFGAQACGNYVANLGGTNRAQVLVTDPGKCNDTWNPYTHAFGASGNLGIGGTFNPSYGIFVQNTALAGITQNGIRAVPLTTSAATRVGAAIYARADTEAAAFTQSLNIGVQIDGPTMGAGSSITEWDGIRIAGAPAAITKHAIINLDKSADIYDSGPLVVGNGSKINKILNGSGTLTFGTVNGQTCSEQSLSVSGASTTNFGAFASPASSLGSSNLSWSAWVSASNTVTVRVCNPTAGNIAVSAVSWGATVNQ